MTDKDDLTDGIETLNRALGGGEPAEPSTEKYDDAPAWAREIAAAVEANSRAIEAVETAAEKREQRALETVGPRLVEAAEENQRKINNLALSTGSPGAIKAAGAKQNGSSTERKFSGAWDDTLGVE